MEEAWLNWYGQAGFLVEGALGRVGIDLFLRPDPRLRAPVCEPRDIPRLDAALATHEHHDHRDVYTLQGLQAHHPAMEVVVPDPIRSLHGVTMEDAYHFGDPPGRFLGYIVYVGGSAVYHSGDTLMYPELAEVLKDRGVSVVMLPVNGRSFTREASGLVGNLSPEEAVDLAADVGAALVPMHWETYPGNGGDIGQTAEWAYRRGVTLIVPRYQTRIPIMSRS